MLRAIVGATVRAFVPRTAATAASAARRAPIIFSAPRRVVATFPTPYPLARTATLHHPAVTQPPRTRLFSTAIVSEPNLASLELKELMSSYSYGFGDLLDRLSRPYRQFKAGEITDLTPFCEEIVRINARHRDAYGSDSLEFRFVGLAEELLANGANAKGLQKMEEALLSKVIALLNKGADINLAFHCKETLKRGRELPIGGKSPLIYALTMDYTVLAKTLIARGADLNILTHWGDFAFLATIRHRNWEMVKFLADKGAKLDFPDNEDKSVLYCAVRCDAPLELVKYLIEKGANVSPRCRKMLERFPGAPHLSYIMPYAAASDPEVKSYLESLTDPQLIREYKGELAGLESRRRTYGKQCSSGCS